MSANQHEPCAGPNKKAVGCRRGLGCRHVTGFIQPVGRFVVKTGVPSRLRSSAPYHRRWLFAPPRGDHWLHEPKWDGFRCEVIKDGDRVRFYSRHGAEYTDRLPQMRKAFATLPADTAILDGELVLIDPIGAAHFWRLMAEMRSR